VLLRAAFFSRPLEELHWVALLVVSGSVLCALCTVLLKMCVCVVFDVFFVGVLASMGFLYFLPRRVHMLSRTCGVGKIRRGRSSSECQFFSGCVYGWAGWTVWQAHRQIFTISKRPHRGTRTHRDHTDYAAGGAGTSRRRP